MTELMKICAVGISGGLLAITLRKERQEIALMITLVTSIIIAREVILGIGDLLDDINAVIAECNIDIKYFGVCIKAVGLAYISQFAAEILRDSGETAIASKVEAAGKVAILLLTMPIILSFLQLCLRVVETI